MPDRIAHNHPTIRTIPASIGRRGGTTRPEVRVDEALEVETGALVRLVLDGSEYRARIVRSTDGTPTIRHAASSPRMARNPAEAANALGEWIDDRDLSISYRLALDVVEPEFRYGLRAPGETAVYKSGRPDDSLASIARNIHEEREE